MVIFFFFSIYDTASSYMLTYVPSISCSPRAASTSPRMHAQGCTSSTTNLLRDAHGNMDDEALIDDFCKGPWMHI